MSNRGIEISPAGRTVSGARHEVGRFRLAYPFAQEKSYNYTKKKESQRTNPSADRFRDAAHQQGTAKDLYALEVVACPVDKAAP